jgi:hypothetical protein
MKLKRKEFADLKQGGMTVNEYRTSPLYSFPSPVARAPLLPSSSSSAISPTVARSPHRRLSSGEARAELPVLPSLCCAPAGELSCTGVAGGHILVSAPPRSGAFGPRRRQSTVDRAPLPRFTTRGPGPRHYPLKNNSLFWIISEILEKGPWTLRKLTRSP